MTSIHFSPIWVAEVPGGLAGRFSSCALTTTDARAAMTRLVSRGSLMFQRMAFDSSYLDSLFMWNDAASLSASDVRAMNSGSW